MRHKQVQELLPWYLNGTLSERERAAVGKHLASCSLCRQDLADWQAISGPLAAQPVPRVPAGALAALFNRLDTVPHPAPHPVWQPAFAFAALVLMLIAVLLMPSAQLRLEWTADVPGDATTFTIYRGEMADRPGETILTAPAKALSDNGGYAFADSSVRPGHSYYYWIKVQGAAESTMLSDPIPAVVDSTLALAKAAAVVCLVTGLFIGLWTLRDEIGPAAAGPFTPLQSI